MANIIEKPTEAIKPHIAKNLTKSSSTLSKLRRITMATAAKIKDEEKQPMIAFFLLFIFLRVLVGFATRFFIMTVIA